MVATAIAGVSALAGLTSAASGLFKNNSQQVTNQNLQYQSLRDAEANQANQQLVQALIDQRSVAGQTDSFGTSLQYDPTTNQWTTTYGALPAAAQTAAMQAGISRNTYDLRQQQLANQAAAEAASRAAPAADAAQRNLASYRPMTADELTGLLTQQASSAQEKTWNPLIADTLRNMARSGTSAGPVLGKLGTDEAQSLRDSLVDAQIKGIENVNTINSGRQTALEDAANTTKSLATPSFGYTTLSGSNVDNSMAQVAASRAQSAGTAPAFGMSGTNQATSNVASAAKTAGSNIADPNYGNTQVTNAANDLSQLTSKGGSLTNLISAIASGSNKTASPVDANASGTTTPKYYSDTQNQGVFGQTTGYQDPNG